jgi:hypothetical protein
MQQYRQSNKERIYKSVARYAKEHPEKVKEWARKAYLKKEYGLTGEAYIELLTKYQSSCAICGAKRGLGVDHKHDATKAVRGILCGSCNRGLGMFRDSPQLLEKAILYLEEVPN